jgi:hypothetical protein
MSEIQTFRLQVARWTILQPRIDVLKAFHTSCIMSLPVNCIYPTTIELYRIPFIQSIIDSVPSTDSFTQDNLAPVRLDFVNLVLLWRQEIELKLVDLIRAGSHSGEEIDRESMFNLATSLFSCCTCSRFLRYPKVIRHACATQNKFMEGTDLDLKVMNHLGETFWNRNGCIAVNVYHISLLVQLLSMANLNWSTTTVQELNARGPIFECIPCNDERTGRATMTWDRVVCP